MADKLGRDLLDYSQSLEDVFRLDCSYEDLKTDKEARRCYRQLEKIRKCTVKYYDFLCKQEVVGMKNREPNYRKMWIGFALIVLSFVTVLCCVVAVTVLTIKNPDMTEMRLLMEYPQPTIIACIAFCAMLLGGVMCGGK